MAIAIAAGSVVAVGKADAQEFTAAELYEPTIGGAYDLGPDEKFALLIHDEGPRMVSADLNLFESPYSGGCPILCVRGFGLQVVRESVGVSHG